MGNITVNELASNAEREFGAALGHGFAVASRNISGQSSFRGGFRIVFADASTEVSVSYGDMELEVTRGGHELFGHTTHTGFEGNMFSHEHLNQYLPRIVASVVGQLRAAG